MPIECEFCGSKLKQIRKSRTLECAACGAAFLSGATLSVLSYPDQMPKQVEGVPP